MRRPKLRSLVAYAFLLTLACDPRGRIARGKGPDLELSAASPKADFTVTMCMDGPELHGLRSNAHVSVDARVIASDPTQATPGIWINLLGKRQRFDLKPGAEQRISIELDSLGPWTGQDGPRCGGPQTIHFALDGTDAATKVAVRWDALFEVTETSTLCGNDDILSSNATLRIEATPPS
jgi:hypothetical protein